MFAFLSLSSKYSGKLSLFDIENEFQVKSEVFSWKFCQIYKVLNVNVMARVLEYLHPVISTIHIS